MNNSQYLNEHEAEVFAEIAKAMGLEVPDFDDDLDDMPNFITNAEQRWELAVFLCELEKNRNAKRVSDYVDGMDVDMHVDNKVCECFVSDDPPRNLVLGAMEMLGIGEKDEC